MIVIIAALVVVGTVPNWLTTLATTSAEARAQEKKAAAPRAADEQAIRDAAQRLARAFEKGDAKAVAGLWTEEGEYRDQGEEPIRGRAALEKAYGGFFAKRPELTVDAKTESVRFLSRDTAVEEGTFSVRAEGSPANSSHYSSLYVRQDGRWLIAMLKEWSDDETAAPKLDDLAFLIGTWKSGKAEAEAQTSYEWGDNKRHILGRYSVAVDKDKTKQSGTQIITIDPAHGRIRAWTFDSEGGIGEAYWGFDGDRWVIDSRATTADGSQSTAVNLLTRHGDDEFAWRSVQRVLDGEKLPDLGTVTVHRVSGSEQARQSE
jgi:uncharacterized protein (TIGR02246 family)